MEWNKKPPRPVLWVDHRKKFALWLDVTVCFGSDRHTGNIRWFRAFQDELGIRVHTYSLLKLICTDRGRSQTITGQFGKLKINLEIHTSSLLTWPSITMLLHTFTFTFTSVSRIQSVNSRKWSCRMQRGNLETFVKISIIRFSGAKFKQRTNFRLWDTW